MKLINAFNKGSTRDYPEGQIVLYQGEKTLDLYRITEGFIKVYDIDAKGNEKVVFILGKGNMFPVIPAVQGVDSYYYFYQALTDITIDVISQTGFRKRLKKDHEFAINTLDYFAALLHDLFFRVECIESTDAKHKVARVLSYLIRHHGKKTGLNKKVIMVPLTHKLIADMSGLTRETASIQLKELETKSIVSKNKAGLLVVDKNKLSKLLDES